MNINIHMLIGGVLALLVVLWAWQRRRLLRRAEAEQAEWQAQSRQVDAIQEAMMERDDVANRLAELERSGGDEDALESLRVELEAIDVRLTEQLEAMTGRSEGAAAGKPRG
ncbi:hypothetical protein [Thioalkalivibrio sp. ALE20]|uniref:hypothetical protein n=1 Tax=Thioalkalivibrio sp. ALE20 TaxID=545275 RepID=UPI000368D1E3|nr:hypothetical protein [Thioalkalivibrio sp. ALE20]